MTKIYIGFEVKLVLVLLFLLPVFSCQPSEEARHTMGDKAELPPDSISALALEDETSSAEADLEEIGSSEIEEAPRCGRFWVEENGFMGEDTKTQALYPVLVANPASAFVDSLNKVFKREAERRHDMLKEEYRRGVQRKAAMGAKRELQMLRFSVSSSIINDRVLYLYYYPQEKYNPDLSLRDSTYTELYDLQTGKKLVFEDVFSEGVKNLWRGVVRERIQTRHDVSDEQLAAMVKEAEKKYAPYMLSGFWQEEDYSGNWECVGHFWYVDSEGEVQGGEPFPIEKIKRYIKPPYSATAANDCLCN